MTIGTLLIENNKILSILQIVGIIFDQPEIRLPGTHYTK